VATISIRIGYLAGNGQTLWVVEGGGEDAYRPILADAISEAARAELAALRADNAAQARQIAALREALVEVHSGYLADPDESADFNWDVWATKAESALSSVPPSSMRLVPLERLREIEWLESHNGDEPLSCPVCLRYQSFDHKPDCWLGKLIAGKETE